MKNNIIVMAMLIFFSIQLKAQQKSGQYDLSGSLGSSMSGKVYLSYQMGDENRSDSSDVVNGVFKIKGQVAEPVFAAMRFKQVVGSPRFKSSYINFFLEPADIKVTSSDSLKTIRISGSKSDDDYRTIRDETTVYNAKFYALNQKAFAFRKAKDTVSLKTITAQMDNMEADLTDNTYKNFILQHSLSPVSLYVLTLIAGDYFDSNKVEPLFNGLSAGVRNLTAGKILEQKIQLVKQFAVGKQLPDFSQADTSGMSISLSSFRGKYVLVDFWASWCGPCRGENPNLVKAFNRYKDKGFSVLGVSLDSKKEAWIKAIHTDKLYWTQVSDLKYWRNSVVKQFDIQAIPYNFLIDPYGKIIAKNLRGQELNTMLTKIFN